MAVKDHGLEAIRKAIVDQNPGNPGQTYALEVSDVAGSVAEISYTKLTKVPTPGNGTGNDWIIQKYNSPTSRVQRITWPADTSGNLHDKLIVISLGENLGQVYFWFKETGTATTNPTPSGYPNATSLGNVVYTNNDSAATISSLVHAHLNAQLPGIFSSAYTASNAYLDLTWLSRGAHITTPVIDIDTIGIVLAAASPVGSIGTLSSTTALSYDTNGALIAVQKY